MILENTGKVYKKVTGIRLFYKQFSSQRYFSGFHSCCCCQYPPPPPPPPRTATFSQFLFYFLLMWYWCVLTVGAWLHMVHTCTGRQACTHTHLAICIHVYTVHSPQPPPLTLPPHTHTYMLFYFMHGDFAYTCGCTHTYISLVTLVDARVVALGLWQFVFDGALPFPSLQPGNVTAQWNLQ